MAGRRITLFVKGNVDVHDSLHSCRLGGHIVWNGLNDVLRMRHPGCLARIKHETWTRSDALLACNGTTPERLRPRRLDLGFYPLESQFSDAVFQTPADAMILSIQPDVAAGLLRHKTDGFLFYPDDTSSWSPEDRAWLAAEFEPSPRLAVSESAMLLEAVVERIRHQSQAPILIYNLSPVIPGQTIDCYLGLDEAFSTRIRKFNLALIELSAKLGVSIVDVDTLLARHGAEKLKVDALHLAPEGYRLVAEEVARILGDLGLFD